MKAPKLPPMPEALPAPTRPQTPTAAPAMSNPTGTFNSPQSPGYFPQGGFMLGALKPRAGRKSLIGG